jgi:hypothetical protein
MNRHESIDHILGVDSVGGGDLGDCLTLPQGFQQHR